MVQPDDSEWQRVSGEILSGMREWAAQHSRATLAEIERETMKRMAQLQARIMEDVARALGTEVEEGEAMTCPECGAKAHSRGEEEKRLQAQGGQEVVLRRGYAVCPKCGSGFFPPR